MDALKLLECYHANTQDSLSSFGCCRVPRLCRCSLICPKKKEQQKRKRDQKRKRKQGKKREGEGEEERKEKKSAGEEHSRETNRETQREWKRENDRQRERDSKIEVERKRETTKETETTNIPTAFSLLFSHMYSFYLALSFCVLLFLSASLSRFLLLSVLPGCLFRYFPFLILALYQRILASIIWANLWYITSRGFQSEYQKHFWPKPDRRDSDPITRFSRDTSGLGRGGLEMLSRFAT